VKSSCVFVLIFAALTGACVSTSDSAPKAEPDKADAARQYYQLGARYYRNGNYELARERLELALSFEPRMAIAHYTLALTYEELENNRLATQHYGQAVKYEPNNFDALNAYAVFLCRQREFDEARKQFEKAIAVFDNDNAEIMLTNAGVCMSRKPDYELAETFFRAAIQRKASYGEALIQLSALKHKTGEDLYARAFLERYLESNDASPSVLFLGMKIEEELGDERASSGYRDRLLQEFPDSPESRHVRDSG